ncbi:hypothetical protein ACLI09_13125 [Flavobacterium sp. RHBU_24]|uniref:hypothetical protein n=1 Tax=Flavobacterium sp. RHBU_24 TaxID=3391185 RepID=UPI003984A033
MKILIALLLLLALPAAAQDAGPAKRQMAAKMLMAYEAKSKSKVAEFYNYLELLSDPKLDTEMKMQVTLQAKKLFGNEKTMVADVFDKKTKLVTLDALLQTAASQKEKYSFTITDFKPARPIGNTESWTLRYRLNYKNSTIAVEQGYFLEDIVKDFGTLTQVVTSAYLGDIKLMQ